MCERFGLEHHIDTKQPALVTFYKDDLRDMEICHIECPHTPLGACLDKNECLFHDPELFQSLIVMITNWRLARIQRFEIENGNWPCIKIVAQFPPHMSHKTIMDKILDFRLPTLKSMCRRTLDNETEDDNQKLSLFKALICRKYNIDITELNKMEAQTDLLLQ